MTAAQQYLDAELPKVQPGDAQGATEVLRTALGMLQRNPGVRLLAREPLRVPHGTYTLVPGEDGVCLRVGVPALIDWQGSALMVPPNATGVVIERNEGRGGWGVMRDVTIACTELAVSHQGTGVRIEAPMQALRDAIVRDMGIGVHLDGVAGEGKNADGVRLDNLSLYNNTIGLWLKGGDSNGGAFSGVKIHGGTLGILDESFLGNWYGGTMLHTIAEHAVKVTAAANYSTYEGTYVEADCGHALPGGVQETIASGANVTFVGGGAVPLVKVGDRVGLGCSRLGFRDTAPNGDRIELTIPHGAATSAIEARRMTSAGVLIERVRLAWVDTLKRFGVHVSSSQVPANGLTMPLGWTSSTHPRGLGVALRDATATEPHGHVVATGDKP